MGPHGHLEDPHPRHGAKPKLTAAGRLHGTLDGRPFELVAKNREFIVAGRLGSLLGLRRFWGSIGPLLKPALRAAQARLLVRLNFFGEVEVFPNPALPVRLLLPSA